MGTVLQYLQVRALGLGLRGRHTAWFVVAAALWLMNRARRGEDVVYRTELKAGERLVIGTHPPGTTPAADA